MSQKNILIPGWSTGENSFGAGKAYMEFLQPFGNILVAGMNPDIFDWVDMVLLPGGQDLYPGRYSRIPSYLNSNPDYYKEFFYDYHLPKYVEKGIPIFGICLGHQMLNVFFGGSLNQNCHHPYSTDHRGELVHEIIFSEKFKFLEKNFSHKAKSSKKCLVNSLHHQGIDFSDNPEDSNLSPEFDIVALGEDKTCVEAMIHKELPIASVQFHPEELNDSLSYWLIEEILTRGEKLKKTPNKKEHTSLV